MDFDSRYAAVASRDRRFDGRFVTAVRTTGIYCRPSCPARTPARSNVEFFPTSAAAQAAGYRACRRCLPEALPGSPEWDLREDLAARAMRLISQGIIDREGVHGLASRLDHSTRHLSRVLTEELGAGPLALARSQRAHTARQLLCTTTLPVSEVAFSAGFSSIRQFNDTIREIFDLTPSQLRARASRREVVDQVPGALTLRLAHREPLDLGGLFSWFAAHSVEGVEEADARHLSRTLRTTHGVALVNLHGEGRELLADLRLQEPGDLPEVLGRVRRLLDLDADPEAVDPALGRDPRLAPRVAAVPGIRIPGEVDLVEALTCAVIGQQVGVGAARRDVARVVRALADPLPEGFGPPPSGPPESTPGLLFPTAAVLAGNAQEVVPGPRRRGATIAAACEAVCDGRLAVDASWRRDDAVAALCALPGIGPWTADLVTLRVVGCTDVLVRGDAAMRRGARRLGLADAPEALARQARGFAPWRSYLGMHLWRAANTEE